MSAPKLRIQTLLDRVFKFGQERTELFLSHSYQLVVDNSETESKTVDENGNEVTEKVKVKSHKSVVPFVRGIGLVYSPEYRLAGSSEELIVKKLHSLHLPAPSFYLTDETPEDDSVVVEELTYSPPVVEVLDDQSSIGDGEFVIQSVGGSTGKKIKYTKISTLYNNDIELLESLKKSIGLTKKTPAPRRQTAEPVAKLTGSKSETPSMVRSTRLQSTPEPVEEPVEEKVTEKVTEEVTVDQEPVNEPIDEVCEIEPEKARPRRIGRRVIRTPKPV